MSTRTTSGAADLFSEDRIHQQLQKIFNYPAFAVSDILRRFLTYISDETLAGRSNTIKEYTIAINVLNKPISFKPQHDAIVRIHAGRLRRALNNYYKDDGARDPIEITVPKGSYVPVFELMKPIANNAERDSKYVKMRELPESVTLAIMPFRTFETDISRQAFSDSIGQQLCAEFGRFTDFSVISYYSTQQLSSKKREIRELVSNFGAQYVLTGNVQFETRRLRVAVQLTDTYSGTQIWTELYLRNYNSSNLFEVADGIVSSVVAALGDFNGLIIQQVAKGFTKNKLGKSYSTLLSRYHEFYNGMNNENFHKTLSEMELTVKRDPFNETAWAFLGQLTLLGVFFNQQASENSISVGLQYAHTALKINPLSQYGHITCGMAHIAMHNKEDARNSLEYALSLNPNASGLTGMIGCLMICAGEYARGYSLIVKSVECNKSHPIFFHLFICLYHLKLKEYSTAYQHIEKFGMPDRTFNMIIRISTLSQMGRMKEANEIIRSLKKQPLNKSWISKEFLLRHIDPDLAEELYKGISEAKIPMLTVA